MSRLWIISTLGLLSLIFCLGIGAHLTDVDSTVISLDLEPKVQGVEAEFIQTALLPSGNVFDIAIVGDGFFQINDEIQTVYTRSGNFTLDEYGDVVLASKDKRYSISPALSIPQDAINIFISGDGVVSYQRYGETNTQVAGHIQLARFINNQGLVRQDDNLYLETRISGSPSVGDPGREGRGQLRQGFLAQSNVESVSELVKPNSQVAQAVNDGAL